MARKKQEVYECEEKDGVWTLNDSLPKVREKREGLKPSTTPEGRERQLVGLAVNLAEKQLRDGTASSAVIVHYLKIASTREVLEREIMEKQSKLLEAKTLNMDKDRDAEDLSKAAIEAMKSYNKGL